MATNSNYSYSNFILEKIIGKDYDKYFDLCFFKSSKPGFFQESKNNQKFYFLNQEAFSCTEFNNEIYYRITNGNKKLSGGSYYLIEKFYEKMLNKDNIKYIFVGDNILSDCEIPSKLHGWNSIFIYDDIEENVEENNYNIYHPFFENKNCLLSISKVDGLNYLFN